MKDQLDLQGEIDALDRHMSNLNNQNYCLQKELEEFVQADDAVRMNLDRKHKVENIRSRVDDVIARSQAEVARSMQVVPGPAPRVFPHEFPSVEKIDRVARKTVASYSPIRPDPIIERRVAWGPGGPPVPHDPVGYAEMKKQYSFGREAIPHPDDRLARDFRRGSPLREAIRSKSGGKNVTFV